MSRDWMLLAPLALGHAGLFVVVVNVVHAQGLSEWWMDRIKLLLLTVLAAVTAVLAWELARGPWPAWSWPVRGYALVCLAIALVGLPATTLARAGRRPPPGISGRGSEIDLARARGAGTLIGTGRFAWLLRLPGNESLRLRKLEWDVAIPGLHPDCDGISLVHVSDLHFSPDFDRRFFEAVADETGAWDADLVVFTGDLIDDVAMRDWIVPVLSRLRGRRGAFAILGNHDYHHQPHRVRRAIEAAGFHDLEGRWARVEVEGATLAIGGTSYPWGPALDPRAMPEADFRLLLSHTPDLLYRAAAWGIDLMLSGHNHGGQVRLPVVGPIFMPSRYSRRFDRGFFRAGPTLMHVSQGVAGEHPLRYGCVPEVSRIVLRCAAPPSLSSDALRSASMRVT
jgi:predicted MPP superfamily phosphohydrolase